MRRSNIYAFASAFAVLWAADAWAQETTDPPPEEAAAAEEPAPAEAVAPVEATASEAKVEALAEAETKTKAQVASTLTSDRAPPDAGRPYYARGTVSFRTLAISDEDPAAERSLSYGVELGYKLTSQATVFLRGGVLQRFVVPSDSLENIDPDHQRFITDDARESIITSPLLVRDTAVGAQYRHRMDVEAIGGRTLSFAHFVTLYLPTSIASQDRALYFAPEAASRVRLHAFEKLTLGMDLGVQYRFHKYAEYFGPYGGPLTQWDLGMGFSADYALVDLGDYGSIDVGGGLSWNWQNTFQSRDGDEHWRQNWGWDLYAFYTPRAWLSVGVSLDQGASYVRPDLGRERVRFFNRDETTLAVTVVGTY